MSCHTKFNYGVSLQHIDALINYSVCRIGKYLYMAGGTGYNANNEAFHSDRAFVYDVVKDRQVEKCNVILFKFKSIATDENFFYNLLFIMMWSKKVSYDMHCN